MRCRVWPEVCWANFCVQYTSSHRGCTAETVGVVDSFRSYSDAKTAYLAHLKNRFYFQTCFFSVFIYLTDYNPIGKSETMYATSNNLQGTNGCYSFFLIIFYHQNDEKESRTISTPTFSVGMFFFCVFALHSHICKRAVAWNTHACVRHKLFTSTW